MLAANWILTSKSRLEHEGREQCFSQSGYVQVINTGHDSFKAFITVVVSELHVKHTQLSGVYACGSESKELGLLGISNGF